MHEIKAFRCKTCGFLEVSDHAAENATPHACRVCGEGVAYHPKTGKRTVDADNWEVLADASPERLAELGLTPGQVERHERWPTGSNRPIGDVDVSAADGAGTADGASSR